MNQKPRAEEARAGDGGLYLSGPHLLLDNKRLARDTTINILDIIRRRFKVTCRIVTL